MASCQEYLTGRLDAEVVEMMHQTSSTLGAYWGHEGPPFVIPSFCTGEIDDRAPMGCRIAKVGADLDVLRYC
jgi:hypothetical protein